MEKRKSNRPITNIENPFACASRNQEPTGNMKGNNINLFHNSLERWESSYVYKEDINQPQP